MIRRAIARLAALFHKPELDRDFNEELNSHISIATEEYMRRGLTAEEARRRALIDLGGIEQTKELHRESRGMPSLEELIQDVRYAARMLRRSPGMTLTAVATLALGIGVNATVVAITNAVLFKGFPLVTHNDRIVFLTTGRGCCVSYPDFEDWRDQAKSFTGMAAVHGIQKTFSDGVGIPETHIVTEISANTFELAGQQPILGRDFTPSDERPGSALVVILRYSFWEQRYAKNPAILGRTVRIDGQSATIVGVMPRGFSFPQNQDFWVPLVPTAEVRRRENRGLWFAFGRMRDGVTLDTVRAEMETIGRRLGDAYPLTNQGQNLLPHVQTFDDFFIGPNATLIYKAMLAAVGFVLLIACANLANMLLSRAASRSREISVRVALGAGRWRIIRLLLFESVLLSLAGGFLAMWMVELVVPIYSAATTGAGITDSIRGSWFNNVLDYSIDARMLAYLFVISIGAGVLFGLAPARRLTQLDVNSGLKEGGRGSSGSRQGGRLAKILIMAEMALAVMLLAGAGVMMRSFMKIYDADIGAKTDHILATLLNLPGDRYKSVQSETSFFDRLRAHLEAIPGVESAALASSPPASGVRRVPYELADGDPTDERQRPVISELIVSSNYFQTMGVKVVGRAFADTDSGSAPPVVIVNQRFVSEQWPGQNPVGKRLRTFRGATAGPWLMVVGVASNVVQNDATRQHFDPIIYLPYLQQPSPNMWVLMKTLVPPSSLAHGFQSELQMLDPDLAMILGPSTLKEELASGYEYRGVSGALFLIFAAVALLLASIGLYAVTAHSVSRRTQEIGVRVALGATTREIVQLVLSQGILPMATGLILGLVGALAVNGLLKSALVNVSPTDPVSLGVASATLIVFGTLGCLIPALRAARVDPVIALRHD